MFGIYITPFQSFLVCWSAVDATHNGDVGLPVSYCLYRVIDQCWTSPTAILERLPRQTTIWLHLGGLERPLNSLLPSLGTISVSQR